MCVSCVCRRGISTIRRNREIVLGLEERGFGRDVSSGRVCYIGDKAMEVVYGGMFGRERDDMKNRSKYYKDRSRDRRRMYGRDLCMGIMCKIWEGEKREDVIEYIMGMRKVSKIKISERDIWMGVGTMWMEVGKERVKVNAWSRLENRVWMGDEYSVMRSFMREIERRVYVELKKREGGDMDMDEDLVFYLGVIWVYGFIREGQRDDRGTVWDKKGNEMNGGDVIEQICDGEGGVIGIDRRGNKFVWMRKAEVGRIRREVGYWWKEYRYVYGGEEGFYKIIGASVRENMDKGERRLLEEVIGVVRGNVLKSDKEEEKEVRIGIEWDVYKRIQEEEKDREELLDILLIKYRNIEARKEMVRMYREKGESSEEKAIGGMIVNSMDRVREEMEYGILLEICRKRWDIK